MSFPVKVRRLCRCKVNPLLTRSTEYSRLERERLGPSLGFGFQQHKPYSPLSCGWADTVHFDR